MTDYVLSKVMMLRNSKKKLNYNLDMLKSKIST